MSTEKTHSYQELRKLAEQFLLKHKFGILATGRKNGTAQQSLFYYNYNGTDI